ncbi:GNAT family N-acetyltransferase [Dokdonella fugitiva]|jgi:RimJ/RimL family protein N-acetyltransferase|uniref:RimJ/RimL family protein N-acetyltransferase n=1 Tax=Dokdonella fugitiva TaxID=328517 RepID=A0A4R2I2F7_9GAMM|nr:GNAT family protein [Dokdonella fugitiva]TCO37689.1 RimJ/RimL family protein N-acetyltransferase [Dokdonella fugitiva]
MDATETPIPELQGKHVRLRALATRDADGLFALHSDAQVMRWWSFPAWTERAQAVGHIERMRRERRVREFYPWVATLPGDDALVGTCSLFGVDREHKRGVIGYALLPAYWGRGLAGRMLQLALGHAFDGLGLERIEADIDPDNLASCRVVERAGFVREGYLRERWRVGGGVQDTALYGLLRREWRRVRV